MATSKTKIDFKVQPKVTWITSDLPDYDDFQTNWAECHDGEDDYPCPAENSREYFEAISDDQQREWDDFKGNFKYGYLIGKTCIFMGHYSSRYQDFRPSCNGGNVTKIESFDDFLEAFAGKNPDTVDIWQDADGLHAQNAHHDGTAEYTVKTLTKKGEQYWKRMCKDGKDNFEAFKHLYETKGLSSPIDYYLF